MAANMHKKYTESKTREWDVPAGTKSGDLVVHAVSGQVGVALTGRGDGTRPVGIPGVTGGTAPSGGVGNKPNGAVVAVDGSWRYAIPAIVNGDPTLPTGAAGRGTPAGTKVYRTAAGAFTLTEGSNTLVGVVDDAVIVNGVAAILIGAVL